MNANTNTTAARQLTGKHVLICFVGFFAVVAAVNAIMIRVAVTTFAGTETASAYKAGLAYNQEEAAAAAQDALNWQVEGRIVRDASGEAVLSVDIRDKNKVPVSGIAMSARLAHPLNTRLDHDIALTRMADGGFRGTTEATAGQWTLILEVMRNGDRVYRTRSRVVLK
ncbi:FixH family protein [Pseudorhodoplanes sp.]|uniref:FixH family protein n=1 Tax=Pseudorhodoplanes sp. TaxID=1934341 RepID=UPI002CDDD1B0|nr:FixH family protein [Pseudorhodoplanes sp.]HWV51050.1 FixH family protein [Pseudorhodoplanes sp.]